MWLALWRVVAFFVVANYKWQFKGKTKDRVEVLVEFNESILLFLRSVTTYTIWDIRSTMIVFSFSSVRMIVICFSSVRMRRPLNSENPVMTRLAP